MPVEFDWSIIEKAGIGGVCLAIIFFGFQAFKIVISQWQNSTDAVNKNTDAFMELSKVFERSHEREVEFQAYTKEKLQDHDRKLIASEEREIRILDKVSEIHRKLV